MCEKKCDFTDTIKKPDSTSVIGKAHGLHIQRKRKLLSNIESMLVKKWLWSPIFSACLMWLVCLMHLQLRENCYQNVFEIQEQLRTILHDSKISFSSGRNTEPLAKIWIGCILKETTNKGI